MGSEGRDRAGPEMAPPAGGAEAASDPSSAAVLLAVHAAVRLLAAGPDAEAQLRRLQLSADPERPGRFRLELLGAGPGAVSGGSGGAKPEPRPLCLPAKCPAAVNFPCFRFLVCKMGMMLIYIFMEL